MTEKIITIRPHRASTMQRAWLCPPAPWRETLMPEMDAGPAAEEGTLLHAAVPRAYRFGDFSGLDEDQRWAMTHCVRLLERLAADVPPACILFEESIEVLDRRLLPILDREVRPDVVIFRPGGLAIVIDWKFGRSVPQFDAGRDLQLLTYAVAVRNGFEGVDRVHVYRFHPRLWDEHRESCVAYEPRPLDNDRNADSFWTGRENVLKRIVAESTPDAPAAPGHAQCLYCKAKLVCKEFARWAEPKPSELPPAVNGSLTPAQLSRVLALKDRLKLMNSMLSDAEELTKRALAQGIAVPGWTLKPGSESRELGDLAAVRKALAPHMPAEAFDSACKAGIGNLEKAFKASTGLKGKAAAEAFALALAGLITLKRSAPTLVAAKLDATAPSSLPSSSLLPADTHEQAA